MLLKVIYFAGGCFWGTAHLFSLVPGVVSTQAGYAQSDVADPTYKEVCTGRTGAAETVRVEYDPQKVSLKSLLDLFYESIDPTTLNRQGNDVGTQYRSGIYYVDPSERSVIESSLRELARHYRRPVVVQVQPLLNFYPAEEYHQDYLYKNPGGYCHIGPELFRKAKSL